MKRGAVWISGLALLGLAVVVWHANLPAVRPGVVLVVRATNSVSALPGSAARVPVAANASGSGEATRAPDLRAESHWDLCGLGRLPMPIAQRALAHAHPSFPPEPPAHVLAEGVRAFGPQLDAHLSAIGPRGEAVRWMLQALSSEHEAVSQEADARLQALAERSGDPLVWHLRVLKCQQIAMVPCAASVYEAWAAAQPDNAAALLPVTEARLKPLLAATPPNEVALAEALAPLAAAGHLKLREQALSSTLLEAIPVDAPGYVQQALLVTPIGIEAAVSLHRVALIEQVCRRASREGSPLRAPCERVARTWARESDSLLAMSKGISIGRDWLWKPEELAALRHELQELSRVWAWRLQGMDDPQWREAVVQPYGCKAVATTRRWLAERGQHGEVGALRQLRDEYTRAAGAPR